jgi:hypothetical protein
MEALGTLEKIQIPGSHFKLTEFETPRNGKLGSVIFRSLEEKA